MMFGRSATPVRRAIALLGVAAFTTLAAHSIAESGTIRLVFFGENSRFFSRAEPGQEAPFA